MTVTTQPDIQGTSTGSPPAAQHTWVVSAFIPVSTDEAKLAILRKQMKIKANDQRPIKALEVMCSRCRRNFEDVQDRPCLAVTDNTHLIGGTPGVRAKRKGRLPMGAPGVPFPAPRVRTERTS